MSLITKLQRSQDLHEQLGRRLERAINLPHEEFKKMHDNDRDLVLDTQKHNSTRILKPTFRSDPQLSIIKDKLNSQSIPEDEVPANRSWLPPPEEEAEQVTKEVGTDP